METLRDPGVPHSFDQNNLKREDFENRVIVYKNQVDVENLESHFGGFQGLVQTQSWKIAFMSTLDKKIALPKIREIYHTLVKVNEGYYKVNVNGQAFHFRSEHIA